MNKIQTKSLFRATLIVFAIGIFLFAFNRCGGDTPPDDVVEDAISAVEIMAPANNEMFTLGDQVEVELKVNDAAEATKMKLYVSDILVSDNISADQTKFTFDTKDLPVGNLLLKLAYTSSTGEELSKEQKITFFSDIVPERKKVNIVKQLPHDPTSYTQGLEFYQGALYESTGQYGTSYVAEVDPETGEIIRKKDLSSEYFGEGLTIFDSAIYQLTWQARKCFKYDLDFNLLGEASFSGQGWGLTHDDTHLIMSNGSDKVFWRDPESFEVTRELYVFDDQSSATQINELELIGGKLYANLYTSNEIIEIDTSNGKILSHIDCSEIVNAQMAGVDYFNGIAYDETTDQIYVTGKLYPYKYIVTFE